MRQLKTYMRNRKKEMLACGPCVCRTLQCWRYASENCGCGEGSTEDMIGFIMNWFQNTPVFNDLTSEQKEQALIDAQTILEGAGDDITPFYNAVRQGRTFANYVERLGLTVDESGPCDSSVYEDTETFIIYISTAGAIHCKYLALVVRRGVTPTKELANKDEISAYLDWVTTDEVTYQFKDWDDEILSFGSVNKGETPEAPTNPTREGYTFTGWSPAVGPINIDTTFVAQYTEIPPAKSYHWNVDVDGNGSVSVNSIDVTGDATYHFDANTRSLTFVCDGVTQATIIATPDAGKTFRGFVAENRTYAVPLIDGVVADIEDVDTVATIWAQFGGPSY